jgi:endonuclease YncB( thermonuclease family)
MVEASGKFVLVVLRGDQVRVHHKKSKHEYRFNLAGDPPEVGVCTFHPNPAGSANPKDFADEAKTAAEWFVANKRDVARRPAPEASQGHGWVSV